MLAKDLLDVLSQKPLGLIFDIDGTLSPIAPTPDAARLFPGVAALLQENKNYAHVAIITGRGISDGAGVVRVDNITYVGTHGLEWSAGLPDTHPISLYPEAEAYIESGVRIMDFAERELQPQIPGLIVQRKTVGGTLHYRLASDPEQARAIILAAIEEPIKNTGMKIGEGKRAIEILAPLTIHKGKAIRRLVEQQGLRGVVFAGDDRTDLNGMLELEQMRHEGLTTLSIAVQHHDTPPAVLEHADLIVQGVDGMAHLLEEITRTLREKEQNTLV